jgi:uncharacterized protein YkwD
LDQIKLSARTGIALTLLVVVAWGATKSAEAQQYTTTTPTTRVAQPAQVVGVANPSTAYYQSYYQAAPPVQATQPTYTYAAPAAGDPYGFTAWLNATRAQYGLAPVAYDPNLSSWAAQNNAQQQSRGMGHYVFGPARRQNSATGSYSSIGAMWMGSPMHRAALLDPSIRWIGIAGLGAYWTFNAN